MAFTVLECTFKAVAGWPLEGADAGALSMVEMASITGTIGPRQRAFAMWDALMALPFIAGTVGVAAAQRYRCDGWTPGTQAAAQKEHCGEK